MFVHRLYWFMDRRRDGDKTYYYVVSDVSTPTVGEATNTDAFHTLMSNPRPHSDFNYLPDTVLYLPAILDGRKLGATSGIRSADISDVKDYSQILKSLGLHHRIVVDHDTEHTVFNFTDDEQLLSSIGYEEENKAYGRFLGVPEEDNKWYDEEGTPSIDEATPVLEHLGIKKVENIKYARLVSWICRPTIEGVKRTIKIGTKYYELANILDDEYGFNKPLNWCEDELERLEAYWY